MTRYIAIIDHDGDHFGAYFPDAPGCNAMGATGEEVVANAVEALAEWAADMSAEGHRIPAPRTYAQLVRSRDCPEPGKGGLIATLPLIKTERT